MDVAPRLIASFEGVASRQPIGTQAMGEPAPSSAIESAIALLEDLAREADLGGDRDELLWAGLTHGRGCVFLPALEARVSALDELDRQRIEGHDEALPGWLAARAVRVGQLLVDARFDTQALWTDVAQILVESMLEGALGAIVQASRAAGRDEPHAPAARWLAAVLRDGVGGAPVIDRWLDGLVGPLRDELEARREGDVELVERRHGLRGGVPETLELLGGRLQLSKNVVRERLVEAEAALARITRSQQGELRPVLGVLLWHVMTEGRMVAHQRAPANASLVTGSLRWLARAHWGVAPWHGALRVKTLGTVTVWHDVEFEPIPELPELFAGGVTAVPLELTSAARDKPAVAALRAEATGAWRVYHGYVCDEPSLVETRRAIDLDRLLRRRGPRFVPIRTLGQSYRRAHPRSPIDDERIERLLARHSRLFVQGSRGWWSSISCTRPPALPAGSRGSTASAPAPTSVRSVVGSAARERPDPRTRIARVLRKERVLGIGELASRLPGVPKNTLARVLDSTSSFALFAAGLWTLEPLVSELQAAPPDRLFTDRQCRWLGEARRAGESGPTLPGWTEEIETRLVAWALDNSSGVGARMLLAASEASPWSEGMREQVERETRREPPASANLAKAVPAALLALAIGAPDRTTLGWVRVNRILRTRMDSAEAISVLRLLVGLGAIRPSEAWQGPHVIDHGVFEELAATLRRRATLDGLDDWNTATGQLLLERITERAESASLEEVGRRPDWASTMTVRELVAALAGDEEREAREPNTAVDPSMPMRQRAERATIELVGAKMDRTRRSVATAG